MTRVAVTGHRELPDHAWPDVLDAAEELLAGLSDPVVVVTALAAGADQRIADLVLRRGGALEVVLPFDGFRATLGSGVARHHYDRLLSAARRVEVLTARATPELSYLHGGRRIVDESEVVLAVWDGEPAHGVGGTGDVVAYARERGVPVLCITPRAPRSAEGAR